MKQENNVDGSAARGAGARPDMQSNDKPPISLTLTTRAIRKRGLTRYLATAALPIAGMLASLSACTPGMNEDSRPGPVAPAPPSARQTAPAVLEEDARDEHPDFANAIFRPKFKTIDGIHTAGTAFLVKWSDGRHLLLTAHHVFSRTGGMARNIDAAELPHVFWHVDARSVDDPAIVLRTDKLVRIAEARSLSPTDLAAFFIADPGRARVLSFAPDAPRQGERIFLLAELQNRPGRLWPAHVKHPSPTALSYVFDDPDLNLNATSGAPLVDTEGRVVGMNVGGGELDGVPVAMGLPSAAIREMLSQALR